MSALQRIVKRHVLRPGLAGASETGWDRASLQRDLAYVRRSREIGFWLMFTLLVGLFVVAVAAAFAYRDDPQKFKAISAGTGVTIMGVVAAMSRLWSQRVKSDLVIAITGSVSEDTARGVLTALLEKL